MESVCLRWGTLRNKGGEMYYWTVDFDLVQDTAPEADEWLKNVGMPAWARQPFVKSVVVLKHALCTPPRRTMVIEVSSLDELQTYLGSATRLKGRPDFEALVKNEQNEVREVLFSMEG
ncbi:hypothetical protein ACFLUT_03970 [Chloroflexota bacterium]